MKKNNILFLIMVAVFMSVPNVNAKSVDYNKTFWITGRSHTTVVDRNYHSIAFTGTTANSISISRYAIDVENTFGNYDYISFSVYNENTLVSSANSNQPDMNITENSNLIAPIVMLNRYPCSVTPIGADSGNGPWYYDGFFSVVCPVYPKDETSDFNLEMLALASGASSSSYWGFSKLFNAFNDGASYDEVIESNEQIKDSVNDLNNNITSSDTTESSSSANSFFEGFDTNDYGLSDIVTMPLELIKGLTSNTCVSLSLTLPFVNKSFELPCMSSIYQEYFGGFYDLYQLITFGFISYWVIVRIFNLVKDFKNPDHDEIEVLDL